MPAPPPLLPGPGSLPEAPAGSGSWDEAVTVTGDWETRLAGWARMAGRAGEGATGVQERPRVTD